MSKKDDLPWEIHNQIVCNGMPFCPIPEAEARELWGMQKRRLQLEAYYMRDKKRSLFLEKENTRLRAVLGMFADEKEWKWRKENPDCGFHYTDKPWLIAQEALKK